MTSQNEVYAALDLGTNNCRLLVARPSPDGFRVIDAFSRIVRLGEGLATSGQLSEPAMARTLEALKICAGKMRRRKVTRARCAPWRPRIAGRWWPPPYPQAQHSFSRSGASSGQRVG